MLWFSLQGHDTVACVLLHTHERAGMIGTLYDTLVIAGFSALVFMLFDLPRDFLKLLDYFGEIGSVGAHIALRLRQWRAEINRQTHLLAKFKTVRRKVWSPRGHCRAERLEHWRKQLLPVVQPVLYGLAEH